MRKIIKNDDPQTLAENLYKQNIEISGKNKTLSLLSKLYEISILTLTPKDIGARVSQTIQIDLSFELVGILLHNKTKNKLIPLAFANSDRLQKVQSDFKIFFDGLKVPTSRNNFLKEVIQKKTMGYSERLQDVWDSMASQEMFTEITTQGHVKSCIVYPLIIQDSVIGILVLCLNRLYNDLVDYEKESIKNFINVIAVALDKALLYEEIKKKNKQLKILDKARAEFITMASHQLRTPPASLKWQLAAVLGGDFGRMDTKVRDILVKAQLTNNSLISLIEDMLNVSRIERGKMQFAFEPTDMQEITQITVDQLLPQAEIKKLTLIFNKPKTKLPFINIDKEKVRQVINNMIDNAIKYTKQGSVTVSVNKTIKDIEVRITDTGKGVPREEIAKIFEKFGRGKDAQNYSAGLGLGLYLAQVVVTQHQGKIWVESPGVGKGSTFAFSLPIKSPLKSDSLTLDLTRGQVVQ